MNIRKLTAIVIIGFLIIDSLFRVFLGYNTLAEHYYNMMWQDLFC
ncbi:hypothetical protein XBFM1_2600002 [Xenorhabdus bovienii str. feltiae Moldova]|uniref:Uncharacterized protein n=1 Tax=Xenorhabdus bovienii str. feltiae Moldova TaxID=1398200 RepID=A0A077NJK8_XENBV|nr:hypothetical protein XBFM1_2600002 [Xenorhabdus bovienii str. feltiae Moldova]